MEPKNPFNRTSTANLLSKLQGGKETAEDAQLMAQVLDRRKKLPEDLQHFLEVADEKPAKKDKKTKKGKAEKQPEPTEKKAKKEEAPKLSKKEQKAADKLAAKKKKEKKAKEVVDLETYKDFQKGDHVSFPANPKQKAELKSDTVEGIVHFITGGDSGKPYASVATLLFGKGWKVCSKLTLIARGKKVDSKVAAKLLAKHEAAKAKKADKPAKKEKPAKDEKPAPKKDKKKKKK